MQHQETLSRGTGHSVPIKKALCSACQKALSIMIQEYVFHFSGHLSHCTAYGTEQSFPNLLSQATLSCGK